MWKRASAVFLVAAALAFAADLPRKAPDFAINLPNGSQLHLSKYQGKVVVLIFILTTCPHCQNAVRCLSEDQKQYGPRGLQVVASAIEQDAQAAVPGFVKSFQPPFPVGFNNPYAAIAFMQHPPMLIPHMPLIAFIDRQGMVRSQAEGLDSMLVNEQQVAGNLRAEIEKMLAESAPKKTPVKRTAAHKRTN